MDEVAGGEVGSIGRAGDAAMAVGQLDPVSSVLEDFDHRASRRDLVGVHREKVKVKGRKEKV